jgi:molybdate transport system substrate-binding protein
MRNIESIKKKSSLMATVSMLGLALALLPIASVQAAELQVLGGGSIAGSLREIAPQFEKATGHTLVFRFGTTHELIALATTGGPFDLGVVPADVFKDATALAKFSSDPIINIARAGLGVAVRAGAPKPDISTPEALKQTLLKAKSITFLPESAAGIKILAIFDHLGISEAMKAKTKPKTSQPPVAQAVADGEAELAVFLTNVLMAPGVDLVGPLPAELQQEVVFAAAVAANTKEAAAAKAFLTYLTTPEAIKVIKAKGMTPG